MGAAPTAASSLPTICPSRLPSAIIGKHRAHRSWSHGSPATSHAGYAATVKHRADCATSDDLGNRNADNEPSTLSDADTDPLDIYRWYVHNRGSSSRTGGAMLAHFRGDMPEAVEGWMPETLPMWCIHSEVKDANVAGGDLLQYGRRCCSG
ncbi:hypothetical protein A0H81_10349 [Grifola frondosa]|uniref:Uncharacterized protein n=1 Tax=Grifola frondosa TaxID=5627 RepID=A0A1C7LY73_GRIFR|nr:hypothetical protein A0H81_10349 [Grifola frondosa]